MNKILIVSPFFPPDKTVASLRMFSFVRFLVSKNEKIVLLTNRKYEAPSYNHPNIRYYFVETCNEGAGYRVFKINEELYIKSVETILSSEEISCCLVSMGPFYTGYLSRVLRKHKVPIMLDYRDPWLFDKREDRSLLSFKNIISKIYIFCNEITNIRNANYISTVSERWIIKFKRIYPFFKNKFVLIENGYDEESLGKIDLDSSVLIKTEEINIGCFGKLFYYSSKYSNIFLRGLKKANLPKITIRQIGNREKNADELLKKNELPVNVVCSTGFMDYGEGISELNQCNVLLIIDDRKDAIGTKIYDYIYLEKPILFVGPKNSSIASIVKKIPECYVCSCEEEVSYALKQYQNNNIRLKINNYDKRLYSRARQNKLLYKIIANLASKY